MRKIVFIVCMAFLFACQKQNDDAIKIFAAASLATALPQAGFVFETQNPGTKLEFNFAASSTLAKQIEQGAKADVYISANPEWMNFLEDGQMLQAGSRFNLLSNKLVCIVPAGSFKLASVAMFNSNPVQKIAVGDWSHVPVGMYTKSALERAGVWSEIENKLIPAVDTRAALAYVEKQQVDCGIVYYSDAKASSKVEIAFTLPDSLHPEIHYPVAVIRGAQKPLLVDFIAFLKSENAARIFRNNGFTNIAQEGSD